MIIQRPYVQYMMNYRKEIQNNKWSMRMEQHLDMHYCLATT